MKELTPKKEAIVKEVKGYSNNIINDEADF